MKLVQGLIEDTDGREHFLKVTTAQTYFSFVMPVADFPASLFHILYWIMVIYAQSGPVFL